MSLKKVVFLLDKMREIIDYQLLQGSVRKESHYSFLKVPPFRYTLENTSAAFTWSVPHSPSFPCTLQTECRRL